MNRRQALSTVALLVGGTIVGAELFLSGCKSSRKEGVFADDDVAFLDEVAETILPATSTSPGAKAAQTGQFMKTFVTDCYEPEDQKLFIDGIGKINDESNKKFSKDFMQLTADQKHDLLNEIDKNAKAEEKQSNSYFDAMTAIQNEAQVMEQNFSGKNQHALKLRANPNYYFMLMKQLTLLGYFTSKLASNTALRYEAVPGKYDGNYPYKKGDKAWATN
jgi:hypothetical protein